MKMPINTLDCNAKKRHDMLHILRNPSGWNAEIVREMRLMAADELERLYKSGKDMQTNTVMMPRELTAEIGAKSALLGEFSINLPMKCCCDGEDEGCAVCGGSGEYMQPAKVPWTTIKEIYAAAVKHLGC